MTTGYYTGYNPEDPKQGKVAEPAPTPRIDPNWAQRYLDPNSPDYRGPGAVVVNDPVSGPRIDFDPAKAQAQATFESNQALGPRPTTPTLDDLENALREPTRGDVATRPLVRSEATAQRGGAPAQPSSLASAFTTSADPRGSTLLRPGTGLQALDLPPEGHGDGDPYTAPGGEAPTVDRTRVDALLGNVNRATSGLLGLAELESGLSVAEAQLNRAADLAARQAAVDTEASQRAALGAARGVRSRGDRALAERQAIGEAGFIGQEAARTASLRQAQTAGDLAVLRATEEDQARRLRMDAYKLAGDLGLNASALEADLSKTNLESATNWINQEFAQRGLDKQLSQQEAERVQGFIRDMALIEQQYRALDQANQQAIRDDLTRRYGIDQQTQVALEQIEASGEFRWDQLLTGFVGGAAQGGTAGLVSLLSDERAKTDFDDATHEELDELLSELRAQTYRYKDEAHGEGERFGFMVQDLEKSRLGKTMVRPHESGFKAVDVPAATGATMAGLAMVHERLKALEEAVG